MRQRLGKKTCAGWEIFCLSTVTSNAVGLLLTAKCNLRSTQQTRRTKRRGDAMTYLAGGRILKWCIVRVGVDPTHFKQTQTTQSDYALLKKNI